MQQNCLFLPDFFFFFNAKGDKIEDQKGAKFSQVPDCKCCHCALAVPSGGTPAPVPRLSHGSPPFRPRGHLPGHFGLAAVPSGRPVPSTSSETRRITSRHHCSPVGLPGHRLCACLPLRNRPAGPTNDRETRGRWPCTSTPGLSCTGAWHFPKAEQRTPHPSLFNFIMLILAQRPFLYKSFELEHLMYHMNYPSCGASGVLLFFNQVINENVQRARAADLALRPASGDPLREDLGPKYGNAPVGKGARPALHSWCQNTLCDASNVAA